MEGKTVRAEFTIFVKKTKNKWAFNRLFQLLPHPKTCKYMRPQFYVFDRINGHSGTRVG